MNIQNLDEEIKFYNIGIKRNQGILRELIRLREREVAVNKMIESRDNKKFIDVVDNTKSEGKNK